MGRIKETTIAAVVHDVERLRHRHRLRPHLLQPAEDQSQYVFGGQKVDIKQVEYTIWLVSFMLYELGYFDHESCRLEPIDNPFNAKLLPMSPE